MSAEIPEALGWLIEKQRDVHQCTFTMAPAGTFSQPERDVLSRIKTLLELAETYLDSLVEIKTLEAEVADMEHPS